DYPAPIYHGDDEDAHGVSANISALKKLIAEHNGLMIATPEYDGFVPPLLANTLDGCPVRQKMADPKTF
ncbi:MAG: NAD(P)H-dependent oxidoreductase, partial [Nisaea sp.]|uniref:NADPH-dependent FMN reductase n=1 Tax=Nisaea sp. TaxID=2024842 RepID=UPI003299400C